MKKIFKDVYLRRLNNNHINCLLQIGETRGFSSMLSFIDCMHWEWKTCLVTWQDQFCRVDHCKLTIIFEVITSQNLWIWHAYYEVTDSNTNINMLNQSLLFNDVLQGRAPLLQFIIMESHIICDTILQMTFILIGPLSWRSSSCHKERK